MNRLYPEILPLKEYRVDVGDGHVLHVEECGNPAGQPVVFLHGGPGSGCNPGHRRYFDPAWYRVILVDQRGCGRSTPLGVTHANTTDHLIHDLETIRGKLGIARWILFGGSWGATLALAYARAHCEAVAAMVLRGSFLARPGDLDWFFGAAGVARVFPEEHSAFAGPVPAEERHDLVGAYHRRARDDDERLALTWARRWAEWSDRVATWTLPAANGGGEPDPQRVLAKFRIETHYAVHRYFLAERPLLDSLGRLAEAPVTIVHGRCDLVCPCEAAWSLHRAIPGSRLIVLPSAGHLASEPAMVDALVGEMDRLKRVGQAMPAATDRPQ